MIAKDELQRARTRALTYLERAGIVLTPTEAANIEVADLGLGELERTGLQLVTYVNGEQYTIPPNTLHWFQAGDEGAIVSEFSTTSRDEKDVFTDPAIQRVTVIR